MIKHLGKVVEEGGEEKLIPSGLKIDSVDRAYPVGELALFWKIGEEFEVTRCISDSIGKNEKEISMAMLILALNQLLVSCQVSISNK